MTFRRWLGNRARQWLMIKWMGILEAARRTWAACLTLLPEHRTKRYLVVTGLVSLLLHALVGAALLLSGRLSVPVIVQRGEPIFADIAPDIPPDIPKETAPPGNPARPVRPNVADRETPRPAAPPPAKAQPPSPSSRPVPPAPRVAEAPTPVPRSPEPRDVVKAAPQAEEPAYEGRNAGTPSPRQTAKAQPEPAQPQAPSPGSEPRVASVPPPSSPPTGMSGMSGGGGIFHGSQGGVVGQAVPLDTPDPNYREYMQKVRQRIYANWRFPREAQDREMHGKLVVEFHIGKDGRLLKVEMLESSGEHVLDISALKAVKLAEHYPPLPDAMQRDVLPIIAIFSYRLRTTQSSTFQLLQ